MENCLYENSPGHLNHSIVELMVSQVFTYFLIFIYFATEPCVSLWLCCVAEDNLLPPCSCGALDQVYFMIYFKV